MSQKLQRFIHRAPRYVLRPSDNSIVRYAREDAIGSMNAHRTRLLNISETGLAIIVDAFGAPQVGDRLKIELPVPGGSQIAWFANVVRIELIPHDWKHAQVGLHREQVIVALHFEALPSGHAREIQRGLRERYIEEMRAERYQQMLFIKQKVVRYAKPVLGYALLIFSAFAILYYLSRPSANYDAQKGSPWGKRFQFFSFEKQDTP